jgi:hypothetical protein
MNLAVIVSPVVIPSHHGHLSGKDLLAILIVMNFICVFGYVISAIYNRLKQNEWLPFFHSYNLPFIIGFIMVNGIAVCLFLTGLVRQLL